MLFPLTGADFATSYWLLGTCNFDRGFCEWINLPIGDQFDWEINRGSTGTLQTGPTEDHTGYKGLIL